MRRRVTDEEAVLLAKALADVKPLKRPRKKSTQARKTPASPRRSRAGAARESLSEAPSIGERDAVGAPTASTGRAAALPIRPPPPPSPPTAKGGVGASREVKTSAFNAGDPRIEDRARRGRTEIERTLDLHGLRQDAAYSRLRRFVETAYRDDCRCVLVVTGKGAPADALSRLSDPAPRGIIRARFLEWVEDAPLRARIARVGKAAPRHGGAGAFYIFLKGRGRPPTRRPS